MNIQDFSRSEGYDLHSAPASLDRRLLREVGPERATLLRQIWAREDQAERLSGLYGFPTTPREAHLLFSHDRRRIIDSFHWVLRQAPFVSPIVDVGCGTGTLLRLLTRHAPNLKLIGVDAHPNLIAAGRSMATTHPNIELAAGDYNNSLLLSEPAGTILSICGIECLDQPSLRTGDDELVIVGKVPERFAKYAQERIATTLRGWRHQIKPGERILLVARFSTLPLIAAVISVAAKVGFMVQFSASERLQSGQERFPAITFTASEANTPDLSLLSTWM
jgi:SAM-dependent methyltransferase